MSDHYFDNNNFEESPVRSENPESYEETPSAQENFNSYDGTPIAHEDLSSFEDTRDIHEYDYDSEVTQATQADEPVQESSYEWNSDRNYSDGEYHYSYINGNNMNADHNPNNYDDAYSRGAYADTASGSGYAAQQYANPYEGQHAQSSDNQNAYASDAVYGSHTAGKAKKTKKPKKSASKGFVAAALAIAVLGSTALGFGGGIMASKLNGSGSSSSASETQETTSAKSV